MPENTKSDEEYGFSYRQSRFQEKPKLFALVENLGVPEKYVNQVLLVLVIVLLGITFMNLFGAGIFSDRTKIEPPANVKMTRGF